MSLPQHWLQYTLTLIAMARGHAAALSRQQHVHAHLKYSIWQLQQYTHQGQVRELPPVYMQ
jgi:hypothetical protein